MNEIYFEWFSLFAIPGFAFRLGIMMAVTLVLGFILYDDWARVWKWGIIIIAFAFFNYWLQSIVVDYLNLVWSFSSVQVIITVILYLLSLGAGALLARRLSDRQTREIKAAKKVYKNLKVKKENGGFPKIDCVEVKNET